MRFPSLADVQSPAWATGTRSGSRSASASRPACFRRAPRVVALRAPGLDARSARGRRRRRAPRQGLDRPPGRARRRRDRRGLGLDHRPRRPAPRRNAGRHGVPHRQRGARRGAAGADPGGRATSWPSSSRRSPRAALGRSPSGTPACARSLVDAAEARPGRHRRPDADDAGGLARDDRDADADGARGARHARPGDDDVPVSHPGLPLLGRHGRAPRRPRDPAPRLVAPRGAPARRVRLVLRCGARSRARQDAARHPRRAERRAPRARGGDRLRGARRRGPDDGGGQLHRLSRADAAPAERPLPGDGARPASASTSTTSSRASARARRSRSATARPARSTPTRLRWAAGS